MLYYTVHIPYISMHKHQQSLSQNHKNQHCNCVTALYNASQNIFHLHAFLRMSDLGQLSYQPSWLIPCGAISNCSGRCQSHAAIHQRSRWCQRQLVYPAAHERLSICAVHSGPSHRSCCCVTPTSMIPLCLRVNLLSIVRCWRSLTMATVLLSIYLIIGFVILSLRSSLLVNMFVFDTVFCELLAGAARFVLGAVRMA